MVVYIAVTATPPSGEAADSPHLASVIAVAPLDDVSAWVRGDLLLALVFVIGAILLTRFGTWFSGKLTHRLDAEADRHHDVVHSEAFKRHHAMIQVVTWTSLAMLYCLTAVLVIQRLGFPLSGIVAPATVAGLAFGFGAQRIVQDVLVGFFVVAERQYGFGDLIKVAVPWADPVTGTVEEVTLRVTRIRTLDGEVVTTPNGQIAQVTNLSRDWARAVVDVPVPVNADINNVTEVLGDACEDVYADETLNRLMLDRPSVMGVESIAVDQVLIRLVARTLPGRQFEVGRALRARVTQRLKREGITVKPGMATDRPTGAA